MGNVRMTKAEYLYFDFFYEGERCREYTELKNTPENMKLMKEAMDRIDGEINLGTFSYSKYFPQSSKEKRFSCGEEGDDGITFREYAQKWYRNNKVQWKPSVRKDFRSTMEGHLIPYFGDQDVSEITKPMIKEYRTTLSELKGRKGTLSNKRNNNITSVLRLILNEAA